jgi:hypothetical protein
MDMVFHICLYQDENYIIASDRDSKKLTLPGPLTWLDQFTVGDGMFSAEKIVRNRLKIGKVFERFPTRCSDCATPTAAGAANCAGRWRRRAGYDTASKSTSFGMCAGESVVDSSVQAKVDKGRYTGYRDAQQSAIRVSEED